VLAIPTIGDTVNSLFNRTTRDLQSMLEGQSWLWLYGANLKIALVGERWGSVNHFWSLAVEEHFYLIWPLVVFFASRASLKRICMICILGAPLLRAMLFLGGFDSVVPYVLTVTRVDSLAIGGLLAVLITERDGLARWSRRITAVAALSAVMLIAIVAYYQRLNRDDLFTTVFSYSLLAAISAWAVLKASQIRIGTRAHAVMANPIFMSLGKYSYGIYVTHMFFVPVYVKLFPWTTLHKLTGSYAAAIVLHAVLAIACSWCIAWVCFHGFEKHFLRLKSLFDYRKPAVVPEAAAAKAAAQLAAPKPAGNVLIRPMRHAA